MTALIKNPAPCNFGPLTATAPATPAAPRPPILTGGQARALESMVALGELFYACGTTGLCAIRPRLFPLLVGPTGAGKSWLVRQVAEKLAVKLLPITFGSWLPLGARLDRPTQFTIIDALLRYDRVALHLDELDKVGSEVSTDWGRSIFNDLWNVLDHRLDAASFLENDFAARTQRGSIDPGLDLCDKYHAFGLLQIEHVGSADRFVRFIAERARHGLWIVGSGTWQKVFENARDSRRIGFAPAAGQGSALATPDAAIVDQIRASGAIPAELLARFSTELLVLTYPNPAELAQLIESLGINALARAAGTTVTPGDLDLTVAGMRTLESLVTKLLLRFDARRRAELAAMDLPP